MRAVGAQMMCLRNDVVPAEQMMCLRNDVPLRGNGGDFLGFAVQQSTVKTGKYHRTCSTDR